MIDEIWTTNPAPVKRYYLNFPMYPFRTLCPRDMTMLHAKPNEFDGSSPLFPAHTQINFLFRKRKSTNFLNFMLPLTLAPQLGSTANVLTQEEKDAACRFTIRTPGVAGRPAVAAADGVAAVAAVAAIPATVTRYIINRVTINVNDMYLQVQSPPPCFFVVFVFLHTHTHTLYTLSYYLLLLLFLFCSRWFV